MDRVPAQGARFSIPAGTIATQTVTASFAQPLQQRGSSPGALSPKLRYHLGPVHSHIPRLRSRGQDTALHHRRVISHSRPPPPRTRVRNESDRSAGDFATLQKPEVACTGHRDPRHPCTRVRTFTPAEGIREQSFALLRLTYSVRMRSLRNETRPPIRRNAESGRRESCLWRRADARRSASSGCGSGSCCASASGADRLGGGTLPGHNARWGCGCQAQI